MRACGHLREGHSRCYRLRHFHTTDPPGAPMANVNVTFQQMEDAATKLNNGRTEIEDRLSQLQQLITGLVSDGYVTDSSSKQFQSSFDTFTNGAKETIRGLEGMAQYLKTAAQTFQDADSQLASALKG
jgi:WXG100 family type VII secretion target